MPSRISSLVAKQHGLRDAFLRQDGRRALDGVAGAVREDDAQRLLAGLHHQPPQRLAAGPQPDREALLVGRLVERLPRHAVGRGLPRHRRRLADQDAGVDGLRQQVLGAEAHPLVVVRAAHFVDDVFAGQLRQRPRRGHQHAVRDALGVRVEGAAEDIRVAQVVGDGVRELRQRRGHDHVAAARPCLLVANLRLRRGQREDDGIARHRADHRLRDHPRGGGAHEHVRAAQPLLERGRRALVREPALMPVEVVPIRMQQAVHVVDEEVLRRHSCQQEHLGAAKPHRAGAADHDARVGDGLVGEVQRVQQRGRGHHRRALVVLVDDRDAQFLAQPPEDVEALGRANVLQVDAAEGGLEHADRFDEPVRVARVELEVEPVEIGQPLEEHRRAFEHRLRHDGPDITQARHGRPVRDDAHEVGLRRVAEHRLRVGLDGLAREPGPRQRRQPHVPGRQAAFDRPDLDLPWPVALVVRKRFLAPDHGCLSCLARRRRQRESLARFVPHRQAGRHRPHLQHAQVRVLEAELDVNRMPVGPLDTQRHVDQFAQFRVFEGRAQPLVGQRVGADRALAETLIEHDALPLVGRQVVEAQSEVARLALRHRDEVGRDRSRHDALAEAQTDVDDNLERARLRGVHRLHHAGDARLHHALDDDAAVRGTRGARRERGVRQRALGPQAAPGQLQVIEHRRLAPHEQERVELAGPRGALGVFVAGRRAHGHVAVVSERAVRLRHRAGEWWRKRQTFEERADGHGARRVGGGGVAQDGRDGRAERWCAVRRGGRSSRAPPEMRRR